MRVGGPADCLVVAHTADEVVRAVKLAQQIGLSWQVIGGGCNVLIADEGLRGLVIVNRADSIVFEGSNVHADSGAKLSVVAQEAVDRGLAGLAWAAGLPGTVGGGVVGNAGAFGGDIARVLRRATVLGPDGVAIERENEWFEFRYRGSRIKRERRRAKERPGSGSHVVLRASLELEKGDAVALRDRAEELLAWRRSRHPAGATMGSTFMNPPDNHAGRLIEQAGLKGYRVGGARVSDLHANFLMNDGHATAGDVLALIQHIQQEVQRQSGVYLELEIELLGWEASGPVDDNEG
jgi:UDP-N-acetylmuramate dehydrogenase